jgi:hypothetical protein
VTDWGVAFLGIIALATLATAVMQIAVLVAAGRAARRLERVIDRVEHELQPLFGQLNAIGREASRAASLTAAQVERADLLFADVVNRLGQSFDAVQAAVAVPAREGAAMLAAVRAALDAIRGARARTRARAEDDDALFI